MLLDTSYQELGHGHCLFQLGTLGPIPQGFPSCGAQGTPMLRAFWGAQGMQILALYGSSQLLAEAKLCKNGPKRDAGALTARRWCSCAASPAPQERAVGLEG